VRTRGQFLVRGDLIIHGGLRSFGMVRKGHDGGGGGVNGKVPPHPLPVLGSPEQSKSATRVYLISWNIARMLKSRLLLVNL